MREKEKEGFVTITLVIKRVLAHLKIQPVLNCIIYLDVYIS